MKQLCYKFRVALALTLMSLADWIIVIANTLPH